ncbi:bifunctional glycosyltransferase/class I SAM-dependent methyltransferase [Nocardioides sp. 616]|uniref:bifunctional glycosyltransferase/class I SAM-dependent methyltransferase n=1 Tax=Nocardioides sp. 616 TaxID=2268090 RepID=UPI0019659496|nr:bifunctional glycosyltransferase/class I SAM-dependent methyltransferase [Nocardioides sp. 616]
MQNSALAPQPADGSTEARTEPRVGVLVVAYNAAGTLVQTLSRLPQTFARTVDHIMVCDDASSDNTYEIGLRFKNGSHLPLTVVRHEKNLGYGGNQKAGYQWAIEHGLDIVVLLHGDGQYAPEHIEDLVQPLLDGEADAVFGSRMLERGSALSGGMPLYKYLGNKVLTKFENKLAGLELSEWHSGYRAYRVGALAELDLSSYSDDFDFDTEIILGLHDKGMRISEVPIPTYYGDEICYVNGMKYARDVTRDVISFRLNKMGLGDGSHGLDTDAYDLKPSPHSSHGVLLDWLGRAKPGRVLDVGCSDGKFAALVRAHGHHVTGVDLVQHEGVSERVDAFIQADLNAGLPPETGDGYDLIVAGDVLEHVIDPESLLSDLRDRLSEGGEVLISIPNFGHWYPRGRTAVGRFDYDQRGPLDQGHVRFFTRRSFGRLIEACDMKVNEMRAVGSPIDVLGRGSDNTRLIQVAERAAVVDRAATKAWPTLFGYQFLYRLERA